MSDALAPLTDRLRLLREDATYHWVGLLVAVVLGLVLASVHWVGLVVGGALVGLVTASLRRALLAGRGLVSSRCWSGWRCLPVPGHSTKYS